MLVGHHLAQAGLNGVKAGRNGKISWHASQIDFPCGFQNMI
jgi:hypothetical protein